MKKYKKRHRLLAMLLAGVMCLGMVPGPAFAAGLPPEQAAPAKQTITTKDSAKTPVLLPAADAPALDMQAVLLLNAELPHAPTGAYLGSLGLPVATGETRIGIGGWEEELLAEDGTGRLDAAQLDADGLTVTAVRQSGQPFAVAALSVQVEYPANGSRTEIILPEGVELLSFSSDAQKMKAASETEKAQTLHASYQDQSAASQGFYLKAEQDFAVSFVYTAPDGTQLKKQVQVQLTDGAARPVFGNADRPAPLAVDGPPPPFASGRITRCVKGNGTWLIWFNGVEAYCCTHGKKGRVTGCPLYGYAYTSLLEPGQKKATHEETQLSIWGALEQASLGLLTEQHTGEMPAAFAAEHADAALAAYCYRYYDDMQLAILQHFPESTAARHYLASAKAAMEQENQPAPLASDYGYYTWIYEPPIEGWQTLALIGHPVPPPPQSFYADWSVEPQRAEGAFDSRYTVHVDKQQLAVLDKVDGAVIEIEPLETSGTIEGGRWALTPAGKQTVTTSGHTMDEHYHQNGGSASASWTLHYEVAKQSTGGKSGRVGPFKTQQQANQAAEEARAAAMAELKGDAARQLDIAVKTAKQQLRTLMFRLEEVKVPVGFAPWDGAYASSRTISVTADSDESYPVYNEGWQAKIAIRKVDSETGSPIRSDAVFAVFMWDKVAGKYMPYGGYNKYRVVRRDDLTYAVVRDCEKSGTEAKDGLCDTVYYTQRNEGRFLLVETKAPAGYYGDWTDPARPGTAGSVAGKRAYAVQLTQENNKTQILLDNAACNAEIAAGDMGGTLLHAEQGDFTVRFHTEKQPAAKHYLTDPDGMAAGPDHYTMEPRKGVFQNDRVIGSVVLTKHDLDAMRPVRPGEHGTASIEGAVYDLYAAQDIHHPDGFTGVVDYSKITDAQGQPVWYTTILENGGWNTRYLPVLQKDHLVASAAIQNGQLAFANLYPGEYYLAERATGLVLPLDAAGKYQISGRYPLVDAACRQTGESAALAQNEAGQYTDYIYKNQFSTVAESRDASGKTVFDGYYLSFAKGYLCDERNHYLTVAARDEAEYLVKTQAVSEDAVLKSGFTLHKQISSSGESNGTRLEGAGFTVYAVQALSRESQFQRTPDGGYRLESILQAYRKPGGKQTSAYDFSGEADAVARMFERDAALVQAYNHSLTEAGGYASGKGEGWVAVGQENEYCLSELFTNAEGMLRVDGLPCGQYLVVETTLPKDVFQAEPFLVTVDGRAPQSVFAQSAGAVTRPGSGTLSFDVLDAELEGYLRVEKIDAETGKAVRLANTGFRLFAIRRDGSEHPVKMKDPDTGKTIDIFYTDGEGVMQTPEKLALGKYRITEVKGPAGYYNDRQFDVVFEMTGDRVWENDGADRYVIRERYANHETLGKITIRKTGEVLAGFDKGLLSGLVDHLLSGVTGRGDFRYTESPLAGAEFTITAAADIYTADHQLDEAGNRTLWYAKGDVVAVVTTGDGTSYQGVFAPTRTVPVYPFGRVFHTREEGAVSVVLPLGSYHIAETKAPHGYLPSEKTFDVTLSWENQEQDIVSAAPVAFRNEREKAKLGVYKKDAETGSFLAGAVFALYTKDDIYNAAGERIFAAGELVATSPATSAEGFTWFTEDIPLRGARYGEPGHTDKHNSGRYTITEIRAPEGYLLNAEPVDVTVIASGQVVQTLDSTVENHPTRVEISKREVTGDAELPGAALCLTGPDGRVLRQWVSGNAPEKITGLHLGEIYTLSETIPAPGYALAESIRFRLEQAADDAGRPVSGTDVYVSRGKDWVKARDGMVIMRDDITRVRISKQDITSSRELPGARLVLKTKDGKTIAEWISSDKPHYIEKLPAGEYILHETMAPDGYEVAEDICFTVQPTGEIQTVVMKDRPVPPVPRTGDSSRLPLWLALLAVSAAGSAVLLARKKQARSTKAQ